MDSHDRPRSDFTDQEKPREFTQIENQSSSFVHLFGHSTLSFTKKDQQNWWNLHEFDQITNLQLTKLWGFVG